MHATTEAWLRKFADDCLIKYGEDVWTIYSEEVRARWEGEEGDGDAYFEAATEIFEEERSEAA